MNLNSCSGCHANPAPGGSSPEINPQFVFFNASDGVNHNTNKLPSFITEKGPVREARFRNFRSPKITGIDAGVRDLFTIAGMNGAEDCKLIQVNFEEELRQRNVIFRIPTPVFGGANRDQKHAMGIENKLNIVMAGNTRTELPNINGTGRAFRNGWSHIDLRILRPARAPLRAFQRLGERTTR